MLDDAENLPVLFPVNPIIAISENPKIPATFSLIHYPNPFNPVLNIHFSIEAATDSTISIVDLLGREIKNLASDYYQEGSYRTQWNASEFSSGIYFIRLNAPDFSLTRKVVFLK